MLARTPNHLRQVLSACVGFPKRNVSLVLRDSTHVTR
jgi:hypothetical protein